MTTDWVWKQSPNGETAHLFRRESADRINVSRCAMKRREGHVLRAAAPDAPRCKQCARKRLSEG